MDISNKGRSPFYPGQPVPVRFFVGRDQELERLRRAASQVAMGKPQAVFIEGEYGIGKSSLAQYARALAEKEHALLGFHVFLGGANTLPDVAEKTVQTVLESTAMKPSASERVRNLLADYVGEQGLWGVKVRLDRLRRDSPDLSRGFLPFLREVFERTAGDEYKGLLLVIDEINGIAANPDFAHFIKTMVDSNATAPRPLPLFLVLTGVEAKRRAMIERHKPVERIFDVISIPPLSQQDSAAFFRRAFEEVGIEVHPDAIIVLSRYSGGLPKLMHLVGEEAFWALRNSVLTYDDAVNAVVQASKEVGRRFLDTQVFGTLHSHDYRGILRKLGRLQFDLTFEKTALEKHLTPSEKAKLGNFLQKMKRLHVIHSSKRGEWTFSDWLTRIYIGMMTPESESSKLH